MYSEEDIENAIAGSLDAEFSPILKEKMVSSLYDIRLFLLLVILGIR